MATVITDQPSVPIATDLNIPEGLPLADPDFRQPGPIDLTLGVEVFSCVIAGELLNRPLAQGTRLGYVITGFLDKETSSDTEINPILVEDRCDFAGPNAAYEPMKDKNPMNTEPTSHEFKTYKKADFCSTFLNLIKKYLSLVAKGAHTIDVPNDQVLRGHNFSPHGNGNFIAKGSVKQHQEDVKDLNYKRELPQLKERSTSVNDLLGASHTIRPRADRHQD